MISKKHFVGLFSILILAVIFVSCFKKRDRADASEVAQQNSLAELTMLDLAYMTEQIANGPQYFKTFNGPCSSVSYDTTGTTVTAVVDYTSTACTCTDGKLRKGKVTVVYPVNYTEKGAVSTTTTSDYYVNSNLIVAERIATVSQTSNDIVDEVLKATITNDAIGGTVVWNATRQKEYIGNTNAANVLAGRYYDVTGSATGTSFREDNFSTEIKTALRVQLGCRSIQVGVMLVNSESFKQEATIDFGDGACDNEAILTYADKDIVLNL